MEEMGEAVPSGIASPSSSFLSTAESVDNEEEAAPPAPPVPEGWKAISVSASGVRRMYRIRDPKTSQPAKEQTGTLYRRRWSKSGKVLLN